jgi:hypothetical protein
MDFVIRCECSGATPQTKPYGMGSMHVPELGPAYLAALAFHPKWVKSGLSFALGLGRFKKKKKKKKNEKAIQHPGPSVLGAPHMPFLEP